MLDIVRPMQTVLVTSRGKTEILGIETQKDNIITLNWHMPVSFEPMLFAISVGKTRFSLKLIEDSKVFIVNFLPINLEESAWFCGTQSGEHIDKFEKMKLTKVEGNSVDCPYIKEASGILECKVVNQIEAGDHIIYVGKVMNTEQISNGKRLFHIEGDRFTGL